jgi:hypothetical protein
MPDRLQISPDALSRELDGEVLVLDLRTSLYFGMTGTAARIWQLMEGGETRDGIVAALVREFSAEPRAIEADVDSFLGDLAARGLIESPPG